MMEVEEISKSTEEDQETEKSPARTGQYLNVRVSRRMALLLIIILSLGGASLVVAHYRLYQPYLDRYNAASVTLKIKEGDKYELSGAKIELSTGSTQTSDDHGKVTFTNLVAGTYKVKISKGGYDAAEANLNLHRGDNDLQIISLKKQAEKLYAVKGFVQDYVSTAPLLGVQVSLGGKTVQTDPNGAYVFTALPPGDFKLIFSKAAYLDKELAVKVEHEDVVTAKVPLVPAGQVIFVSNRSGRRSLYTSAYDASNQHLFVEEKGGEDFSPVLAPNNKRIVFSSTRDKVKDAYGNDLVRLYVVGQDGKELKKVADDVASDFSPLWSPNGQRLFFSGYTTPQQEQATYKVYDASKDSTTDIGEAANGVIFSPDSTTIAYNVISSEERPPAADAPEGTLPTKVNLNLIKTLNLATGERKTFIKREQFVSDMRFSADGKTLSYEVILNSVRRRFEANLSGEVKETEVAVISYTKRRLVLSPDNSQKAFVEERDGKKDLYIVDKNDTNEKRLTTIGVLNDQVAPQWDETGHYLTFAVKREAENALYIVSSAGGEIKKITDYYVEGR